MGPVAGHAKKGTPNRKIMARLSARLKDYGKVNPAKQKGFHTPGSMQKH